MTAYKKLRLLGGAAALALGAPAMAHAADAAPRTTTVQELVVTAEKRTENLKDVPQSVTALSGEGLQIQRASTFEDYVNRVPGMALVSSQPGSSRLALRGINTGGVSATIGTYVDETPYGSVTALANGAVLTPDLDTFDMQRLEVLRGPQGTLYGASSLGGLLKFVTNPPDPSRMAGSVDLAGEKSVSSTFGGDARGMLNVPLSDRMAIRASGYYNDQPGYIDDPVRGAKDVNKATYEGLRVSFLAHPIDPLTIRLTAMGQEINSRGQNVEDVDPATLNPVHGDLTQSRTFAPFNKVDYRIYNATVDYDLGFASLLSATSYGTLHENNDEDASVLLGPLLTAVFHQPLGAGVFQNIDQKKFTQEVRLTSPAQKFEWLVGGFFTRERNLVAQDLAAVDLAHPPQAAAGLDGLELVNLSSNYTEYAGFGNIDYHFTDRFDVSAGGRWSHNKQDSGQTTSGALVGPTSVVGGASAESVFTFAVAPKYKINDDTTVYARISKGYRPGGPNALQPLAPAAVPRTFQSDTLINYEVGIKGDAGPAVTYDLAAFYIKWSRIQLLVDVDNFGVNSNGGDATSRGVEGSIAWAVTPELNLSANGAYVDAHLDSDTGPLVGGHTGDELPFAAKVSGALNADYSHPLSGDMSYFVGASLRFTGRRKSDFNPTIGQLSLPSYTTLDLRAGVEVGQVRVEAYAKNLGDERGILSISGSGATPNGAVQAGIIRPRTVGIAVSDRF
jgi:iron complex outermembrane recepter protein